jgi:hypothetical protein
MVIGREAWILYDCILPQREFLLLGRGQWQVTLCYLGVFANSYRMSRLASMDSSRSDQLRALCFICCEATFTTINLFKLTNPYRHCLLLQQQLWLKPLHHMQQDLAFLKSNASLLAL